MYPRKYLKLAGSLLAAALILPSVSFAQESKVVSPSVMDSQEQLDDNLWLSANVSIYNTYYYRGIELYADTAIQPSFNLNWDGGELGSIGASVWLHLPGGDDQQQISGFDANGQFFSFAAKNKFVEVDPSIYYSNSFGMVNVSVGHIWYTNPHSGDDEIVRAGVVSRRPEPTPDTAEVFGSISLDAPLQPSLTVYHDYRRFEYEYYSLGLSHTIATDSLGEGFAVTPYANFGFATNAERAYNSSSGLKHINVGLRSNLQLGNINVTPILTYVFGFDDDRNGVGKNEQPFRIWTRLCSRHQHIVSYLITRSIHTKGRSLTGLFS